MWVNKIHLDSKKIIDFLNYIKTFTVKFPVSLHIIIIILSIYLNNKMLSLRVPTRMKNATIAEKMNDPIIFFCNNRNHQPKNLYKEIIFTYWIA